MGGEATDAVSGLLGAKRMDCKVLTVLCSAISIPTFEACAQGPGNVRLLLKRSE